MKLPLLPAHNHGKMASLLLLTLLAFYSMACDPGHPVTYDNRTDQPVEIFVNGFFDGALAPMEKKTFDKIEFGTATFEARDFSGRVLYSETLTWDELKDAGWRIVITDEGGGTSPSPTRRENEMETALPP